MKDLENALLYLIARRRDLNFKQLEMVREINRLTTYINALEAQIKMLKEQEATE